MIAPEVQGEKRRVTECVAFVFGAADVLPGGTQTQALAGRDGTGTQVTGGVGVATGLPGDEERGVVVGGVAVVLDVLALLPDAEVVESGGGVEAHRRAFLFTHIEKTTSGCVKSTAAC